MVIVITRHKGGEPMLASLESSVTFIVRVSWPLRRRPDARGRSGGDQPTRRDFMIKEAVRSLAVFPAVIALIAGPTLAAAQAPPANTVYACVKDPDGDGDGRLVRIVGINEP